MIFSVQKLMSDDQAITATANSTNVIDLGAPGTPYGAAAPLIQDLGKGVPVPIRVQITEDFNNLTSIQVEVKVASDAALTTNVKVLIDETIVLANAVTGKATLTQYLPNGVDERYLGVTYTVAGVAPTTGKVTAGITMGNQTNFTGA